MIVANKLSFIVKDIPSFEKQVVNLHGIINNDNDLKTVYIEQHKSTKDKNVIHLFFKSDGDSSKKDRVMQLAKKHLQDYLSH